VRLKPIEVHFENKKHKLFYKNLVFEILEKIENLFFKFYLLNFRQKNKTIISKNTKPKIKKK